MLNDSFSCRSTFFCILRDKNGYTIINGTGNYYIEAQTREQTRTDIRKTVCDRIKNLAR